MLDAIDFDTLLNHLDEPVVCYDMDKRYIYVNAAAARFAGHSPSEMIGRTDLELFKEGGRALHNALVRVIEEKKPLCMDHEMQTKGRLVTLEAVMKPIQIEGGDYVVAICRDVTEYRRSVADLLNRNEAAMADIRSQKVMFENLVMNSPYALGYSNTNREFIMVNDAYVRMFGYSAEELVGRTSHMLYADSNDFRNLAEKRFNFGAGVDLAPLEVMFRRKSGDVFPGTIVGTPVKDAIGETVGYLGCIRDVTDEKQMNERLEVERARTVHASRMATLGEMAAGVAHEINNPLEIINSCASILLRQVDKQVDPKTLSFAANKIQETVHRIANIVKALRNISREGSDDPLEAVTAVELVDEVLELCDKRFKANGVELKVNWLISEETRFFCRRIELSQVLLNLLSNAFDAVEGTSEAKVSLEISQSDSVIEFSVSDSGYPIQPEVAARMMDPFFTTKELGKGTGLGLSISKAIVERHCGTLKHLAEKKDDDLLGSNSSSSK